MDNAEHPILIGKSGEGPTQQLTGKPGTVEEVAVEQEDYEDEELPTEEELVTLRRIPGKIPLRVYTIAYVELVERLSYYGCAQVCITIA